MTSPGDVMVTLQLDGKPIYGKNLPRGSYTVVRLEIVAHGNGALSFVHHLARSEEDGHGHDK